VGLELLQSSQIRAIDRFGGSSQRLGVLFLQVRELQLQSSVRSQDGAAREEHKEREDDASFHPGFPSWVHVHGGPGWFLRYSFLALALQDFQSCYNFYCIVEMGPMRRWGSCEGSGPTA
jgi:hypothetical protein